MPAKILFVDDDVEFQGLLKTRLEANGFDVFLASNGDEGLQQFVSISPDLVVADLIMPKTDGFTMIRELRRFPKGREVPIIVVTAKERVQELCAMEGVKDYLVKPFDADDLIMRIKWNLRDKLSASPSVEAVFFAPTTPVSAPASAAAAAVEEAPLPPNGKKILLVDDDEGLKETLKIRLESNGYKILMAFDGENAIQMVKEEPPDLIVLDVMMPKLDGFSTLKQINQMREKKIPVIVMTGTAIVMEDDFRIEGARAFMRKPIDGSKLSQQIKEILA